MSHTVFICNPGTSHLTDEEAVQLCKCRHARVDHWWGGGDCGEDFKNGNKCPCRYFRPRQ